MTTRSAFLKAPFETAIRTQELRELRSGEVLVDIEACGVCGTDLHFAAHAATDWQPFGHEIAGTVRAVADDVSRFAAGDRVALDSSAPCGRCENCREGRPLECLQPQSYWGQTPMGFADAVISPQQCVYQAGEMDFDVASLLEPLGVSIDLVQTADIVAGDRVLVIGPGPLGLMAIPLCFQNGAAEVYLAGRSHSETRLRVGRKFGATIIETDRTPLEEYAFGKTKPNKILVTSPPQSLPGIFSFAKPGTVIAFIGCGFGPQSQVSFDADEFHFKRLQLRASMASPALHGARALEILGSGLFDPRLLISHRFALADIGEALLTARDDRRSAVKIVVHP